MNEEQQIIRDEALRLKPYLDCCGQYWRNCACAKKGKLSIGIGRNLDDVGISEDEAHYLFRIDLAKARSAVYSIPWVLGLHVARRAVLINMCFNLGLRGLLNFKRMLAAAQAGNWRAAAAHLLDSNYAHQVGERAVRLAKQLETAQWR